MRIKPPPESPDGKPVGPGTRATRSSAHAQKRHDDRHAERDYFGNVVKKPTVNSHPTVGSTLAEMSARGGGAPGRADGPGTAAAPATPATQAAPKPMRLDAALVSRGLSPSREKAKASIAAGMVYVDGLNNVKASTSVGPNATIEVRGAALRYVGRGGLKLEKALETFSLDVAGATCLDLGASTGGFTDCLLQHGAARVVAVDVGHGQLDPSLACDPRVASIEGMDARAATPQAFAQKVGQPGSAADKNRDGGATEAGGPSDGDAVGTPAGNVAAEMRFDLVTADLSFISLGHVLDGIRDLLVENGRAVLLVKPQFEAGRERVGKHGVVKEAGVHREVLGNVLSQARQAGLAPCGLDFSPIKGPEGNIEYLLLAKRAPGAPVPADGGVALDVRAVVDAARQALG